MTKKEALTRNIDWNLSNFHFDLQLFSYTPTPRDLMIGAGKVYFRRWDEKTGRPVMRRHIGNATTVNITANVEKIQKYSSMDAAKELYAEAVKSIGYKLTVAMDEYNPFNLALALYGEEGITVQEEKSITGEIYEVMPGSPLQVPYDNITNVKIDPVLKLPSKIYPATMFAAAGMAPGTGQVISSGTYTGTDNESYYVTITTPNSVSGTVTDAEFTWKKGILGTESAPVTVTGTAQVLDEGVMVALTAGSAVGGQDYEAGDIYEIQVKAAMSSYTPGVDFILDETQLRGGIIPIPDSTSIPEGSKVLLSYDVPEAKYPNIYGGTVKTIEGDFVFIGDPSVGRPYKLEVWHAVITPTSEVGLITDEWGSMTIEASILADRRNHPDHPFFIMKGVGEAPFIGQRN